MEDWRITFVSEAQEVMTILGCSFLDLYTEYIVMAQTPNAKHPYSSCHHTVTLAFGSSAKRLCGHGVQLSFIPMQSLQRSKISTGLEVLVLVCAVHTV